MSLSEKPWRTHSLSARLIRPWGLLTVPSYRLQVWHGAQLSIIPETWLRAARKEEPVVAKGQPGAPGSVFTFTRSSTAQNNSEKGRSKEKLWRKERARARKMVLKIRALRTEPGARGNLWR